MFSELKWLLVGIYFSHLGVECVLKHARGSCDNLHQEFVYKCKVIDLFLDLDPFGS